MHDQFAGALRVPISRGERATGTPVAIGPDGGVEPLVPCSLGGYEQDEKWLQALIQRHPSLLPVSAIEPGFGTLIPAAREVACGHGNIDNLYLTPAGEIVFAETKLWRNPEARRKVVAQALDYVAALMAMGWDRFEAAVLRARGEKQGSLYRLVSHHPDALPEAAFIDALSRNLRRGRFLAMVVGDGIRQETEALADLLQGHAGAHFTFALVEIGIWRDGTGRLIALPGVPARTVMIERGIVVIDDSGLPSVKPMSPRANPKAQSISEEMFYETLAQQSPALPAALRQFLDRLEPLGVHADLKAALTLRAILPDRAKPVNLGMIEKNGKLWTNYVQGTAPQEAVLAYLARLADLIGGQVTRKTQSYVSTNGTSAPLLGQLLPGHAQDWEEAIAALLDAARREEGPS